MRSFFKKLARTTPRTVEFRCHAQSVTQCAMAMGAGIGVSLQYAHFRSNFRDSIVSKFLSGLMREMAMGILHSGHMKRNVCAYRAAGNERAEPVGFGHPSLSTLSLRITSTAFEMAFSSEGPSGFNASKSSRNFLSRRMSTMQPCRTLRPADLNLCPTSAGEPAS